LESVIDPSSKLAKDEDQVRQVLYAVSRNIKRGRCGADMEDVVEDPIVARDMVLDHLRNHNHEWDLRTEHQGLAVRQSIVAAKMRKVMCVENVEPPAGFPDAPATPPPVTTQTKTAAAPPLPVPRAPVSDVKQPPAPVASAPKSSVDVFAEWLLTQMHWTHWESVTDELRHKIRFLAVITSTAFARDISDCRPFWQPQDESYWHDYFVVWAMKWLFSGQSELAALTGDVPGGQSETLGNPDHASPRQASDNRRLHASREQRAARSTGQVS
jgi:hypothetical protein